MKILYLEARKKSTGEISVDTNKLPKELFLAYSIQYRDTAEKLKAYLMHKGFKIRGFQQVLGCTKLSLKQIKQKTPILLISSGMFHALNLALQSNAPVYIYNNSIITKLDEKTTEKFKQKRKAALSLFFAAKTIGIIVSTKPGQENLKRAEKIKSRITKNYPEKKSFIFLSNTINLNELENFRIDFWINTACPGLFFEENSRIANADDIPA